MKRLTMFLVVVCAGATAVYGQPHLPSFESSQEALTKSDARRYTVLKEALLKPASDLNVDVKYYKLNLAITTSPGYLRGVVTMNASSVVGNLRTVTLDLMNTMTVDSVKTGDVKLFFAQQPSTVTVTLDRAYDIGELIAMDIYYQGVPGSSGSGGFYFTTHGTVPWMYTLSQPYGAKDWWPCKDHPLDKADSVDIWVTVGSTFKVGSNGKLVAVIDNGNGTKTHRWEERYPISTYLVSLAITDYAEFTNWFKYSPTDSMPVLNYVLPEHLSAALASLPRTVDMLGIYSDIFGLYPFINEKYGHCEISWGGGMEHQTMTSLGGFDEGLVAHELAHMWFGDMITCANWHHLWLNEGFATYSTALYYERRNGQAAFSDYMNGAMASAKGASGSLYLADTSSPANMFAWNRVYAKGATVLHMLRHVLGDSVFFASIRTYGDDPRLRFGVATTEDFRQVCELVSGEQLGYFFDEWVYGAGYPDYTGLWKADSVGSGYEVTLRVLQTLPGGGSGFFTMPIDVRLSAGDWDTTVTVMNTSGEQQYTLLVSHNPTTLLLDPEDWTLGNTTSYNMTRAILSVDTRPVDFHRIAKTLLSCDTTFMVRNIGGAEDSIDVSLDYGNVMPDSAIAVSPVLLALRPGDSAAVTFTIRPPLLLPQYYSASVLVQSRFGSGPTLLSKPMLWQIVPGTDVLQSDEFPRVFALAQNYPNPFNPSTTIRYGLPQRAEVTLTVFNTLGQQVAQLVNGEVDAGYHEVKFDGNGLSNGVYLYRMQAGAYVETKKLVLVR
jgi:aminopeptidase N